MTAVAEGSAVDGFGGRPSQLEALLRTSVTLPLPRTVDFLEPPERVLEQKPATTGELLAEMVDGFLLEYYATSRETGDTYCSSLTVYLRWCSEHEVDPILVTRPQASRFAAWMSTARSAATGEIRSPSRRSQILAACTSFLEYCTDAAVRPEWTRNAFGKVKRPKVDRTPKSGKKLTVSSVNQVVLGARTDHLLGGVLGKLLIALQARMGLRPGDVCRLNLSGVRDDEHGGYELLVPGKGGVLVPRWLPPDMASDFYTWLKLRPRPAELEEPDPDGPDPLFVHPRRRTRLNVDDLLRLIRRAAASAGLPFADELCCRDLRPWFNTTAKAMGASLEDRQAGLGHANPKTTQGYDRTEWARRHDPAIKVSAAFGEYPAEARIAPLLAAAPWKPPQIERGCDCAPVWPELHVDLSPVGVDQTAVCVITEQPEPGTHQLQPYCRKCRCAFPGPFRVVRVLDDASGRLLDEARAGLTEAALYPEAVQRRSERRRQERNEEG